MERIHRFILFLLLSSGVIVCAMEGDPQSKDEVFQAHPNRETIYDYYQDRGLSLFAYLGLAPSNWSDYLQRPTKWDAVASSIPPDDKQE